MCVCRYLFYLHIWYVTPGLCGLLDANGPFLSSQFVLYYSNFVQRLLLLVQVCHEWGVKNSWLPQFPRTSYDCNYLTLGHCFCRNLILSGIFLIFAKYSKIGPKMDDLTKKRHIGTPKKGPADVGVLDPPKLLMFWSKINQNL